ncbi:hypothetical protein AB1Y20_016466 [Prymnesium parvum]|uniref:Uncharacterized protein n=1 Tax=Prymnesium parvum TaxID=97485 RepID=A0AB34IFB8_PRYPA
MRFPPAAWLLALLPHAAAADEQWAVVFDAGSTGTRVHVYSWPPPRAGELAAVRAVPGGNLKVKPGVSTFDGQPEAAGASVAKLVRLAASLVPAEAQRSAAVMLKATAGMRLLPKRRAQRLYDALYAAVVEQSGFAPKREQFGTLSGEDEGVFGWLAVNFLLSTDKSRKSPPQFGTVGALDLGGGSTQITMPAAAGAPSTLLVPLPAGRQASVFTHSHLGYGNNQVLAELTRAEAAACLSRGAVWDASANASEGPHPIQGTGSFAACEGGVRRVLAAFNPHGQPAVRGAQPFVAMSLFFYSVNFATAAGYLPQSDTHSPRAMLHAAASLCKEPHASLFARMKGKDPLTPDDAIQWRCFHLLYAARLLTDGYGFAEDSASIEFLGDVGGVEVEWTLGAVLHMLLGPASAAPYAAADRAAALLLAAAVGCCLCVASHRRARGAYQPLALGAARRLAAPCCSLAACRRAAAFTEVGAQLERGEGCAAEAGVADGELLPAEAAAEETSCAAPSGEDTARLGCMGRCRHAS